MALGVELYVEDNFYDLSLTNSVNIDEVIPELLLKLGKTGLIGG